jgi:hypothetical protein
MSLLLPLYIVIYFAIVYFIYFLYLKYFKHESDLKPVNNRFIQGYVLLLYYIYPFMASLGISPLRCRHDIDGNYFLVQQPALNCFDTSWLEILVFIIFIIIVWVFGMPLILFYWLYRHKEDLQQEQFKQRFGELYRFYKPEYYWWGIVGVSRKMCILLPVLFTAKLWESWVANLVLFASIFFYKHSKPYISNEVNNVQHTANLCLFLFLYFGILNR